MPHLSENQEKRLQVWSFPTKRDRTNYQDTVCVDMIVPYKAQIKQNQQNGMIRKKDLIVCTMTFVYPATGWFEIAEVQ